jgi:peptidoglycan/xylan/chitin deacetylase (PgdA/CDA1 family)
MWPEGIQCAACFTFDLDAETAWLADPDSSGNTGLLSLGRYGPKVGVPLILDLLDRHSITATFFVPGLVAEMHPRTVESIVQAGHELGNHSYSHMRFDELSVEEQEQELRMGHAALERFGARPTGFRSPWETGEHTLDLLKKHGYLYSSDMMDDFRPYRHLESGIIELPINWVLDDSSHFWFGSEFFTKRISPPSEVREIWDGEFEGTYEYGGLFTLLMHPQCIGRPSRLKMLDAFLSFVRSHNGVWIATCQEIARYVDGALPQPG